VQSIPWNFNISDGPNQGREMFWKIFKSIFVVDDELLGEVNRAMQADQTLIADGSLVVDDQDTAAEDGQAKELLIVFRILFLGTEETFDVE